MVNKKKFPFVSSDEDLVKRHTDLQVNTRTLLLILQNHGSQTPGIPLPTKPQQSVQSPGQGSASVGKKPRRISGKEKQNDIMVYPAAH